MSFSGKKHSEETKEKMRLIALNDPLFKERIARLAKFNVGNKHFLGKHHTKEARLKMSLIKIGKKPTKETLIKFRAMRLGKKASEETKKKMRLARAKQIITPEHKRKIGLANKGRKASLETKLKLSVSHKGYVAPESQRINMGLSHLGEKSNLWRGGRCKLKDLRLNRIEWKLVSKKARSRDKNTCQKCGFTSEKINLPVHHKIPYRIYQDNSLSNLITLCNICHKKEEMKLEDDLAFLRQKVVV